MVILKVMGFKEENHLNQSLEILTTLMMMQIKFILVIFLN